MCHCHTNKSFHSKQYLSITLAIQRHTTPRAQMSFTIQTCIIIVTLKVMNRKKNKRMSNESDYAVKSNVSRERLYGIVTRQWVCNTYDTLDKIRGNSIH